MSEKAPMQSTPFVSSTGETRNPIYEGQFDGETAEQAERRRHWAKVAMEMARNAALSAPSHGEQVRVPEGYVLVPQRMELMPADIASIMFHCGGDEEATEVDDMFVGGILWVGDIKDDDDKLVHGLHIATADYPEEGSTTLVEFARAPAATCKHRFMFFGSQVKRICADCLAVEDAPSAGSQEQGE